MKYKDFFIKIGVCIAGFIWAGYGVAQPIFQNRPTPWADSLIEKMSLDEQIGQLFMIPAWSDTKHKSFDDGVVMNLIQKYHVGGIIFFQGGPVNQIRFTNRYQSVSSVPLLIGMDAEWSLSMRLDSTILYPRQMTLGAIQNSEIITEFAKESAKQLKRLGVHFSFSPVVDINNNPENPVISNRSFGENRDQVVESSMAFMRGLQENGVLACAKHFPGHGDTDVDSHVDMPVIPYSRSRLDSVELFPYPYLMKGGLAAVMVGHLSVPVLEKRPHVPATLSKSIVDGVLKRDLGFQGLIFTDALNMEGVAKYFGSGEMEALAIEAGNDVLLFPTNIPLAIEQIKKKIKAGSITENQIRSSCHKILQTKEWCGLSKFKPIPIDNIWDDINGKEAVDINEKIIEQSLVLLKNEGEALEKMRDSGRKKALVLVGTQDDEEMEEALAEFGSFDFFHWSTNADSVQKRLLDKKLARLEQYDDVIFAWVNTSNKADRDFGVSKSLLSTITQYPTKSNKWLVMLANPYAYSSVKDWSKVNGVVMGFQDDPITQRIVSEAIMGARGFNGILPVSINNEWKSGYGITTEGGFRMARAISSSPKMLSLVRSKNYTVGNGKQYAENFNESMSAGNAVHPLANWHEVDSLALLGLKEGAYPGCRVLVAHRGKILYDRCYGYLDENHQHRVTDSSVYDLASITKLAASSLAMMWLVDHQLLDVHQTLGHYLDFPKKSPYAKIKISDMMLHQAGLKEFIPFHKVLSPGLVSGRQEGAFQWTVAHNMFSDTLIYQSIRSKILDTPLGDGTKGGYHYKYSDLGYYFLREIAEKQTKRKWKDLLNKEFYQPMGLRGFGYNPLEWTSLQNIAPTEKDETFRYQLIHGYVHDQGAALMGGVAGHAGLFGNAYDLANIMYMLLEKGKFGSQQFIQPNTVDMFNKRYKKGNRRGLIFDKPTLDHVGGSCSPLASDLSFGHTGFTGTICWADPANDIIFIFLSNRIHPSAENKKIQQMNIRTNMQTAIYRQILKSH